MSFVNCSEALCAPAPLVVICGPTGVGKTAATIQLAQIFNGEVVNADSIQVYRYLDIGTAKPTAAERACVAHHLVDIINPDEAFDAAAYARHGHSLIARLHRQGRLPFVAGGTGLYIKALLYGLCETRPLNMNVRTQLKAQMLTLGPERLYRRLAACDPATAARVHPNDHVRIVRALEVYEITGKPITQWQSQHGFAATPYRVLKIGLTMERALLYRRIDQRVDLMLAQGLEAEVRALLKKGYHSRLKPMQSIGYRHMCDYLEGRLAWDEAVRLLKRDTRRYAKRQMTWFKADPQIRWFLPEQLVHIGDVVAEFTGNMNNSA